MSIHPRHGDMDRFYDILVPFLTNEPLESSVKAEQCARVAEESKIQMNQLYADAAELARKGDAHGSAKLLTAADLKRRTHQNTCGSGVWRHPQKSRTAYVVYCRGTALHVVEGEFRARYRASSPCSLH